MLTVGEDHVKQSWCSPEIVCGLDGNIANGGCDLIRMGF